MVISPLKRGSMQRSTLDILQSTATVRPLQTEDIGKTTAEAQDALFKGVIPEQPAAPSLEANLKSALEALEAGKPESEILAALANVKDEVLADACFNFRLYIYSCEIHILVT